MIAILDYGAGNLTSVGNVLEHLGFDFVITRDPAVIAKSERLIFPGVGAAGAAMHHLKEYGVEQALRDFIASEKPVLGICVGCQILLDSSEEDGGVQTLGLLPGKVKRFESEPGVKIPHMGWNQVVQKRNHPLWEGIADQTEFYFVHSYFPIVKDVTMSFATTTYGTQSFDAAFGRGNVFATQFHTEKSGEAGLRLMANFAKWNASCWEGSC
jgi:glutamine amidotransferase